MSFDRTEWHAETERRLCEADNAIEALTKRFNAHEMRHAREVEALAIELNAMKDRLEAMDEGRAGLE